MSPPSNPIESYFTPSTTSSSSPAPTSSQHPTSTAVTVPGDGFTVDERHVDKRVSTAETAWTPQRNYEEVEIASIVPGPGCRTFAGRVVNFFDQQHASKMPRAARGCVKMVIKDDTGMISVRLWYVKSRDDISLGQLLSVWTTHVSNGEHGSLAPWSAPLFTSIFPERDRGCHLKLHGSTDDGTSCKSPLGYKPGRPLSGLLTLQNFVNGGHEVIGCQILVAVKAIAAKKTVTTMKGQVQKLVNVSLFDHTAEATLTLWGAVCASAEDWQISETVLLITNPGLRGDWTRSISLNASTTVEIDPEIEDATWLRGFAARLRRREHVNPAFPTDNFAFESLPAAQLKIKYTLADLDEFARAAPSERFVGYMSVLVTELHLSLLQQRNMLMCNECCGVPIYANVTSLECKHCSKTVALRINPQVLGPLVDETGSTSRGAIILSDKAWEQLFGRSARDLVKLTAVALKKVEQRLVFVRLTLVFGWAAEELDGVGRIYVSEILS